MATCKSDLIQRFLSPGSLTGESLSTRESPKAGDPKIIGRLSGIVVKFS